MKAGQTWLVAAAVAAAASAPAAELSLKVTLPQIEQRGPRPPTRPYVAIWLRKEDNTFARNLAVWYQIEAPARRGGFGGAAPGGAAPGGTMPGGPPRGGMPGGGMAGFNNPKTPGGARWLNEVREWWADSGNQLQFPVDGLTSASRAAGTHELTFAADDPRLAGLPPGNYKLMVEAAREHGGKEFVAIPFSWPGNAAQAATATGKTELGLVELTITP